MGGSLWYWESVLEWVLVLAVGASGLCMLALGMTLVVTRYRMHKKREDQRSAAGDN
jgi:hypothetical protein